MAFLKRTLVRYDDLVERGKLDACEVESLKKQLAAAKASEFRHRQIMLPQSPEEGYIQQRPPRAPSPSVSPTEEQRGVEESHVSSLLITSLFA